MAGSPVLEWREFRGRFAPDEPGVPGCAAYLARLDRMTVPSRIGLIQGGAWQAPASLARNPRVRGYVVFLRNG